MKVVHLSTTDYGGAYKAAARISESMRQCGVDSELLIRTKTRADTVGTEIFTNPVQKLVSKMKNLINLILSEGEVVSDYLGTNVTRHPLVKEADVVVLHWVNSFISYKNVEQLMQTGKPLIWVMHDMWLFTGGCHIDHYCGGYEHGCGKCPYIKKKKLKEKDISRRNVLRKRRMLEKGNIAIVAPSQWLATCLIKSKMVGRNDIANIPNPIDTNIFKNQNCLCGKYPVKGNRKIILYGAMNLFGDTNKGGSFVIEAFKRLVNEDYSLVMFGDRPKDIKTEILSHIHFLGFISSDEQLADIYNMADVVIMPSHQENYPNTILEAAACQIPVVAFKVGGIPDIVRHKETGYLVDYGNLEGLIEGIRYCAANKEALGKRARQCIEETNGYAIIGSEYKEIAQRCVGKNEGK